MTEQEYAVALKRQARTDGHFPKLPQSYTPPDAPKLSEKIAAMLLIEPLNTTELTNLLGKSRAYILETLRTMMKDGDVICYNKKWKLTK